MEETHIKLVVWNDGRKEWAATVQTQKPQEAEITISISRSMEFSKKQKEGHHGAKDPTPQQ